MRSSAGGLNGLELSIESRIPGLVSYGPNTHVEQIKGNPWSELPALLGKEGSRILVDLLLDCGVFVPFAADRNSLSQLSGASTSTAS